IAEFSAKEYWKENYATAKKDTLAPNTMWRKRPYGQIAKCAEAQALRKAFPEYVPAQPTAEEMEGRAHAEIDMGAAEQAEPSGQPQVAHGIRRKSESAAAEQKPASAGEVIDNETGEILTATEQKPAEAPAQQTQQQQSATQTQAEPVDDEGGRASPPASGGLINTVKAKVKAAGLSDDAALKAHQLQTFDGISTAMANKIIAWAKANKA
ncbi:TPA: recombinase RecT, partial [Burkholderia vietnamiensis]|nr:recombinase RecT [Burkholderia vietnamiensis]